MILGAIDGCAGFFSTESASVLGQNFNPLTEPIFGFNTPFWRFPNLRIQQGFDKSVLLVYGGPNTTKLECPEISIGPPPVCMLDTPLWDYWMV